MNKITAVIPVRQGSQRVKNKNFKNFCGKSLLEYKIEMIILFNIRINIRIPVLINRKT